MRLGVVSPVGERIVLLADDYALRLATSLGIEPDDETFKGMSGAFISFLSDAVETVA